MTEKFDQWKEYLESVYGANCFFTKDWLRREHERGNTRQVSRIDRDVDVRERAVSHANKLSEDSRAAATSSLEDIRADLGDCKRCKLCGTRKTIVFGEGNPRARLMFIGEGPGEQEDLQGRPFVGRAGQLLDKIIEAMGLKREDAYIANVVKCRPPANRRPEPEEVAACEPVLFRQIDAIAPEVIVALGATALECLLKSDAKITKARGTFIDYRGRKLLPTYHPAYLLRNPPAKKDVWEDMRKVMAVLGLGKE
ncbi:MAG: uracil-DNA glycosylase [Deltaproteobacteria bacterium]|nr:uracil-DNA glycosylase [Deltaproteobacteria bacterium]